VQGCLPLLQWPDHTRRFLKRNLRSEGLLEHVRTIIKAPCMPSLAIALDAFWRQRTGLVIDPKLETASTAVLLSYVFGWSTSTTNVLCC
jgi:hypothetical protein